jgi:hypothetical protein
VLGIDLSLSNVGVIGNAAALPSFSLDFAAGDNPVTKYGFSFTRATAATYVDSTGLIATAASGELRYTYDPVTLSALGVLIEEARTNLSTASTDIVVGSQVSVSGSQSSPDGGTNGVLVTESTANSNHYAIQTEVISFTSGTTYTLAVFIKPGTATRIQLTGPAAVFGASQYANFGLTDTGAVLASSGVTATIQKFSGGWYRCSIAVAATASTTGRPLFAFINADAATRLPSYTGTSLTVTGFGWQVEAGAFPTSYIPTAGAAATRNADVLSLTGAVGRTNLLSYSEDFSNAAWSKAGLLAFGSGSTVDAVANPIDGSLTADKITEDSTTGIHAIYRASSATSYNGSAMTMSFYALRAAGSRNVNVLIASDTGFANFARYVVDLGSGSVSTVATGGTAPTSPSCTATAIGGGWYRVSVSATLATAGGYAVGIYLDNNTAASNDSYAGDGTSALYLYGAQLETGSSATAYIATTNGPRTVENVASWFNGDAGTWVVNAARQNDAAVDGRLLGIGNATLANYFEILHTSLQDPEYRVASNSVITAQVSRGDTIGLNASRYSFAYAIDDVAGYYNGLATTTDSSVALPFGYTQVVVGARASGASMYNGTISRIRYYPRRLPNATLQSLAA